MPGKESKRSQVTTGPATDVERVKTLLGSLEVPRDGKPWVPAR